MISDLAGDALLPAQLARLQASCVGSECATTTASSIVPPVVGARKYLCFRKCLPDRSQCFGVQFAVVYTEENGTAFVSPSSLQKVDAGTIPVKYFPPKFAAKVYCFRIYINKCYAAPGSDHDLRHLLAKSAVPHNDNICLLRQFRIIKLCLACVFAGREFTRQYYQKRR